MIRLDLISVLKALSEAIDAVEKELLGATTNHSKRVAWICTKIGNNIGFTDTQISDIAGCAILHDSALSEYISDEISNGVDILSDRRHIRVDKHCILGEHNAAKMPFSPDAVNAVLYHHEEADGGGPFGRTAVETPLLARIIHLGDQLDITFDLSEINENKLKDIVKYLIDNTDKLFDGAIVAMFNEAIGEEDLYTLTNDRIDNVLQSQLPGKAADFTPKQLIDISSVFAKIIDYKSHFTSTHSTGIAEKAYKMGEYYGYDEDFKAKLYFAGALHDVGKLIVNTDVLEKNGALTDEEFSHIKNHAVASYNILNKINGLEDAVKWAYLHHEKLDGSGYPFGKKASELDHEDRLLGCIDIYQALVEKRPYKDGLPHEKAIIVLRRMADMGKIDSQIVKDIDHCFSCNETKGINQKINQPVRKDTPTVYC